MFVRFTVSLLASCTAIAVLSTPLPAATRYRLTSLEFAEALGINNAGYVVGHEGEVRKPDGQVISSPLDNALRINSTAQVAGRRNSEATLWSLSGGVLPLGFLPGTTSSYGFGVNDLGWVVGKSYGSTIYSMKAFLWRPGMGMTEVPGLAGSVGSEARAVDLSGAVLGNSLFSPNGSSRPFIWRAGSVTEPLFDGYGEAWDMNARGQVVGGTGHAFIWSRTTGAFDLGVLPDTTDYSHAYAIDEAGIVVGENSVKEDGVWTHAVVWTAETGLEDLNDLLDSTGSGWRLQSARDVNDHGWIVGYGINPTGIIEAFLLTPVPEPSSLLALFSGLTALLGLRTRHR